MSAATSQVPQGMTAEEALALVDGILAGRPLSNIQETVFCQTWEGKTYAEIAEHSGYEHSYIRDVGFKLWHLISEALGQKVSKSNIRAILRRYARGQPLDPAATDPDSASGHPLATPPADSFLALAQWSASTLPESVPDPVTEAGIEWPSGPVPLDSPFYIERQPLEAQIYTEALKPGSLIQIKSQPQVGKTSLLLRIIDRARRQGIQTVSISLHKAEQPVLSNLEKFLRWFCANVSRQLHLPPQLNQIWDPDMGSNASCTAYFEDYVLRHAQAPILIALDEINQLFQYPAISHDFLFLLRSWYEDGKDAEVWRKVRWVLVHSTDMESPPPLNQPPLTIGWSVQLPGFTDEQVLELARRHGLDWAWTEHGPELLQPLVKLVGRRPSLVRLALYHLTQSNLSPSDLLSTLLEDTPATGGIFKAHLRSLLVSLRSQPDLVPLYSQIVCHEAAQQLELEPTLLYRLEAMGLVCLRGGQVEPACELYRLFFQAHLTNSSGVKISSA